MAGVQWTGEHAKSKSAGAAKAMFRHNDKERREEARHSNPHIDTSRTYLNWSYRGRTYEQRCKAFDQRLAEIDMGKPGSGKNARTLMQSVILYPPEQLRGDVPKLRKWFRLAGEIAEARFGSDNVIDMAVDVDETHEYYDPERKEMRMSSEHGHLWLVPEVGGKLNGKAFSQRSQITGFNRELDEMSQKVFGCPLMDGTGRKGGRSTESLKAKSEAAEIIANADAYAERRIAEADKYAMETVQRAADRAIAARQKMDEAEERQRIAGRAMDALEGRMRPLQALQAIQAAQDAVKAVQTPQRPSQVRQTGDAIHQLMAMMVEDSKPQSLDTDRFRKDVEINFG